MNVSVVYLIDELSSQLKYVYINVHVHHRHVGLLECFPQNLKSEVTNNGCCCLSVASVLHF